MIGSIPAPLFGAADVSAAAGAMSSVVRPLMLTLSGLASLVCTFFLVQAGIAFVTSSGKPEKLAHAKIVLRNSLLGLVIVLSAASLTTLLTHAYSAGNPVSSQTLPAINAIATDNSNGGLTDVLLKAITSMFRNYHHLGRQAVYCCAKILYDLDTPDGQ